MRAVCGLLRFPAPAGSLTHATPQGDPRDMQTMFGMPMTKTAAAASRGALALALVACAGSASSPERETEPAPSRVAPTPTVPPSGGPVAGPGDAGADAMAPSGVCAIPSAEPMPPAIEPPAPSDWLLVATERRGSPDPDALRTKHQLDRSSLHVDVYPRGLDTAGLTVTMGGCTLHPDGVVRRSVPGNPDPENLETGLRFSSVPYDPVWQSFRLVPGARYAIDVKRGTTTLARFTMRMPTDFPSLTSASRTQLTWPPFSTSDVVSVSGFHLDANGYENRPPSLAIPTQVGSAPWDASDPGLTHAVLQWGRSLSVGGLATPQTLNHLFIRSF